jgi:hypothetical protein
VASVASREHNLYNNPSELEAAARNVAFPRWVLLSEQRLDAALHRQRQLRPISRSAKERRQGQDRVNSVV